MAKELLVNVSRGEEVRVALVEDAKLEEIYLERDSAASNVGNIYLGKVTNVEGSIQAAFVDFGYGRNGFLHVQDLHPDYFPEGGRWDRVQERVGKKIGRRDRPPIQDCLRRGDHIVVQIIKEGIGTKGPTLTSYPSIPGRFLVMMPGVAQMGVSKNIEDEEERRRLRKILDGLRPPKNVGFIIRTAGMGKSKTELERDFKYLTRLYEQIEQHKKHAQPPALLYSEGDLVTRTVRDVWSSDVERVICDDPETALRIKQFFKLLMPRTRVNVQLYQGSVPLFHAAGIEQEIETMFSRQVPLPSGGSLVIDSTEAAVCVDVNSGKFREHDDAEETAFRTDMEAAEEICRQLRLRDLGGVVIVDFIDLRYSRHREALFNRLTDLFKRDKAKSRHLPMNEFGLVAITRQRMRPDLKKSVFMPCPWSRGTGFIKTPESMALDVMRRLRVAAADEHVCSINVRLYPTVALHVLNTKRQALADLERQSDTLITLRQDEALAADDVELELLDERGVQVQVEALSPSAEARAEAGGRRRRRRRRRDEPAPRQDQAAGDKGGLIDLPELLELGELKLEEVEKLVNELGAEETAARDAARKDPQRIILEALRSGALFDDEVAAPPEPAEEAAAPAPSSDRQAPSRQEQERGRRRRRGRGRDREQAERRQDAPASTQAAPWGEHQEDIEVASVDGELVQQQGAADHEGEEAFEPRPSPPLASGAPGAEANGAGREGGRRRRRRRRGRRDRELAVGSASTNGEAGVEPDSSSPMQSLPDALLDERLNGNRIDRETHTITRAARDDRPHPSGGFSDEQPGGRRRRRRRKGRGLRGQLIHGQVGLSGPGDPQLDVRFNGNRGDSLPPRSAPAALVSGVAPAPAGEGGSRRRRRRRRRGNGSQQAQVPAMQAEAPNANVPALGQADDVPLAVSVSPEAEMIEAHEGPSQYEYESQAVGNLPATSLAENDNGSAGSAGSEPSSQTGAGALSKRSKAGRKTAKSARRSAASKGARRTLRSRSAKSSE